MGFCGEWYDSEDGSTTLQLLVPKEMVQQVLQQSHSAVTAGHFREQKTLDRIRERFYWPGYRSDVKRYVKSYWEVIYTWEKLSVDIAGPPPVMDKGNCYILMVVDAFSKYAEAIPVPNQQAVTVTTALVQEILCRYGIPKAIHTDQGTQFESELFIRTCDQFGTEKTRTTPYHPSGNGQAERMNRTVWNMLAKTIKPNEKNWDVILPKVMMTYRATVHSSTGQTPYRMMFGRQCRKMSRGIRAQQFGGRKVMSRT
uniref:RNA-directed DNA polymerase n=1 Tax=Trichuris muris TaxID=70415 RepID=A0A5S6QU77_TRIMR